MFTSDFLKKVSRLRIPLVTQVEVTRKCNFHCPFCYLGKTENIDLDKEKLKQALEEIHSMGGMKVLFTGGEPLLYEPLLEMTHFAKKIGFICEINTNGYYLDKFDYSAIASLYASINISIHSNLAEEHDKMVGVHGAWERVVASILELRKHNANIFINTVLTDQEVSRFKDMKKFVEEFLDCRWVPDVNISPTYEKSYDSVNRYTVQIESLENIIREKEYREIILGEENDVLCTGECKAARNLCFIDSQGYVYPCLSFKIAENERMKATLENIKFKLFSEIWNKNEFLQKVNMVTKNNFSDCLSCDLYNSCHKCIAENYLASEDFYIPSKEYCIRQHILLKDRVLK